VTLFLALLLPAAAQAVTFTAFGDVNGTSDAPPSRFTYVVNAVNSLSPSFSVTSGDAILDSTSDSVATALSRWSKYRAVESKLAAPVYRTAGDNERLDTANRLTAWTQTWALPLWYSVSTGGVHFVFLNTAYSGHMGWAGLSEAQGTWLRSDLAAQPRPSTIVVVTHYPLFNGKTNKPYALDKKAEATALGALFTSSGVDLVLCGDTHVYRRTVVGGINYVQVHPAGSTPRTIGVSPIPALVAGENGQSGQYGFQLVTVNADRSIVLKRCTVSSTGALYVGSAVTVKDVP
jgi:hypothetical protein